MIHKGAKVPKRDIRAKAILDSAALDDDAICKKYRISKRTWQRWLAEFREGADAELTRAVAQKKRAQDDSWGSKIPKALNDCLDFISRAAREADHKNADTIHAVAGAMKMVIETDATRKYIDARISGQDGSDGTAGKPVPAASNVTPIKRAS